MPLHDPPHPGPWVATPDGVEIATWDFGGTGPELILTHGTGFHGRCWTPLAPVLTGSFHMWGLDQRGHGMSGHAHDRRYDDWSHFVDDLLSVVDHLALDRPFAAGHSLGAAVAILSGQRRPAMFAAIYAYEPIIIPPRGVTPPEGSHRLRDLALKRRNVFASIQAARENFAGKLPFSRFDPAALDAYLVGGLRSQPDGTVVLACPGDEEATVYEGAPRHDGYDHLGDLHLPVTVAGSAEGRDIGPELLAELAGQIPSARLALLTGVSHFGPMKDPDLVATAIVEALL